jgi:hypothetical protein
MAGGHGEKLSRKKEQAIAALLVSPTLSIAAEKVGVHERTLFRWLKNEDFKAEYQRLRRECVTAATAKLQSAMGKAVDAMLEILEAEETRFFQKDGEVTDSRDVVAWGPRLGAAKTILEMGLKGLELEDIERRVSELERKLK